MADTQENLHFLDYWRVVMSRKEVVLAVALLVIVTGVLVTYSLPKVYMASCVIQVKEESPDLPVFTREYYRYDPLFLRTQFEIIQSGPVIEEVIRRLDLNEKLGRAYGYLDVLGDRSFERTFLLVSGRMKVQQYRDTNLIEIQIYMDEPKGAAPQLAAEIANEVADVYRDITMQRSRVQTERALQALYESLEDQRRTVNEAEQRLADIQKRYQLTIVSAEAGSDSELTKMSVTQLEQQRIRQRMELEDKRARYQTVMSLSPEGLLEAAPYLVGDPGLVRLVGDKRQAEVELNRQMESLGVNHPDVVRTRAVISELTQKITEALNGLKTGVKADYEAAQAKTGALEAMLEEAKASDRGAAAEGYREYDQASADLEQSRRVLEALETRYAEERIKMRIPRTNVERIEPAKAPPLSAPVRPKPLLNIILSVVLGFGAGVGLAFFVEYLDTSVKTIEDIERHMGAPVLGVIPQKVKALCDPKAENAHAEAYRVLRANVRFSKHAVGGKTLCVTSGSVGEGKSLTVFNMAYVSAQFGDKVLLVDSDLHRPRQHKILGIDNKPGLANVLVGEATLEQAIRPTPEPNLHILPSGRLSGGVHGLLASPAMAELVGQLRQRYDFVFFDSPPIIGVSDTSMLVRNVDGVLLVIQHRKYPRAVSARAKDMILNFGANLLGVVLNNINVSRDYTYYYYQQHYQYYPRRGVGQEGQKA